MAAETSAEARSLSGVGSLSKKPSMETLEDGHEVLAEAKIFKLLGGTAPATALAGSLTSGGPTPVWEGGMVNEHKVQFVRNKEATAYALVVYPRESKKPAKVIAIDSRTSLEPASMEALRAELMTVKPDGESMFRAIFNSEGEETKLFLFKVSHPGSGGKLLEVLGIKPCQEVVLGFKDRSEAAGWYIVLANAIGLVQANDPLWQALDSNWYAGHAAVRLQYSWQSAGAK